jgi:hypothetical protein
MFYYVTTFFTHLLYSINPLNIFKKRIILKPQPKLTHTVLEAIPDYVDNYEDTNISYEDEITYVKDECHHPPISYMIFGNFSKGNKMEITICEKCGEKIIL